VDNYDYYGITREDINDAFLKGSKKKILMHANGLIAESKRQMNDNNHRLAGLNLSIAQLMIEYVNEDSDESIWFVEPEAPYKVEPEDE